MTGITDRPSKLARSYAPGLKCHFDAGQFVQQIKLAKEQGRTAQTRLAETHYDYRIADVEFAYSVRGQSGLEIDSTLH